jgi:hypothetical protein
MYWCGSECPGCLERQELADLVLADSCSGQLGIKCHPVHHVRYGDVACDPREPAVRRSRTVRSNTGSGLLHTRSQEVVR